MYLNLTPIIVLIIWAPGPVIITVTFVVKIVQIHKIAEHVKHKKLVQLVTLGTQRLKDVKMNIHIVYHQREQVYGFIVIVKTKIKGVLAMMYIVVIRYGNKVLVRILDVLITHSRENK